MASATDAALISIIPISKKFELLGIELHIVLYLPVVKLM